MTIGRKGGVPLSTNLFTIRRLAEPHTFESRLIDSRWSIAEIRSTFARTSLPDTLCPRSACSAFSHHSHNACYSADKTSGIWPEVPRTLALEPDGGCFIAQYNTRFKRRHDSDGGRTECRLAVAASQPSERLLSLSFPSTKHLPGLRPHVQDGKNRGLH